MVLVQPVEPAAPVVAVAGGPADEPQDRVGVAVPERAGLAALVESSRRILADRLQHREAHVPVGVLRDADDALLREVLEVCDDVARRSVAGRSVAGRSVRGGILRHGAHQLHEVEGASACEDGQPGEQPPLRGSQQVVAPVDGAAQGPLARRQVAAAALEEAQAVVQALGEGAPA